MSQATIEYNKPYINNKINKIVDGVLSRIVKYNFSRHSESVPGSNVDRTNIVTTFLIKNHLSGRVLEQTVEFNGFVGTELIGNKVQYSDRTIEKTTYFDPAGRDNDPSYRMGKKETERVQRIAPENGALPIYISKETSQLTL